MFSVLKELDVRKECFQHKAPGFYEILLWCSDHGDRIYAEVRQPKRRHIHQVRSFLVDLVLYSSDITDTGIIFGQKRVKNWKEVCDFVKEYLNSWSDEEPPITPFFLLDIGKVWESRKLN